MPPMRNTIAAQGSRKGQVSPPCLPSAYPHRGGLLRKTQKGPYLLERAKGFEPSTPTLARSCSTPELHPHPLGMAAGSRPGRPIAKAARAVPIAKTARPLQPSRKTSLKRPMTDHCNHARHPRRPVRLSRPARHRAPTVTHPPLFTVEQSPGAARHDRRRPHQEPVPARTRRARCSWSSRWRTPRSS